MFLTVSTGSPVAGNIAIFYEISIMYFYVLLMEFFSLFHPHTGFFKNWDVRNDILRLDERKAVYPAVGGVL